MVKKLVFLSLLASSLAIHSYPKLSYGSSQIANSQKRSRLECGGIAFMSGTALAGAKAFTDISERGINEETIKSLALTIVLFAAGAYCFDKAERMY